MFCRDNTSQGPVTFNRARNILFFVDINVLILLSHLVKNIVTHVHSINYKSIKHTSQHVRDIANMHICEVSDMITFKYLGIFF